MVLPIIASILGSTLFKWGVGALASIGITAAAGQSIKNVTTSIGINKEENIKQEVELLKAQNELLKSSQNANPEALNAVQSENKMSVQDWILIGALVLAAGAGTYMIIRKEKK